MSKDYNSELISEINRLNLELVKECDKRKKIIDEYMLLEKKYKNLSDRYCALSNSKLGKLTLLLWRKKSKKRKK